MRLIDADALIDKSIELYCKDCDRRKCIKNGEWRIVYEIGDAHCRACGITYMQDYIAAAPTIDAVPVVRCKDCKYWQQATPNSGNCGMGFAPTAYADDFCSFGERSEDDKAR